ncbi:holo-ACP synthase [Paenibacillus sp. LHD-117]|uniref:holo-ACP synthase n=1 Tax=Paenibacillus sp. LHD-117 TaxID=3071412 RepID=UPI0027DF2FDA|nr:holo-ACP synthase [Paenibacillus sp. LHD-117]MDQ6421182.1 holo-ACP synthase [Paenibacillus sp. LHD-117]
MIIGIGHDLTDVLRVEAVLEGERGSRFLARVLTESERKLAESYAGARLHQFTAGRFAAKEAVSKAFGCGIGELLGFQDIDIFRDADGKPVCGLSEGAWMRLGLNPEFIQIHVTITHERAMASAFVVVERIKR